MNDSNLIFIVSQPRSGSTLLQKIISNTNLINTVSEHWFLLPFLSVFRADLHNAAYDSSLTAEVMQEYLRKLQLEKTFHEEGKQFLLKFYEPLMINGAKYVLDKTPRYYEILNELLTYFPNAKIIVLIRDPVDVLMSIIQTWKIKSLRALDYYTRDILLAPVLMNRFAIEQKHNQNVKCMYYEDLVEDAEKEISAVFNWLDLPFDKGVLNYQGNEKTSGKRGDPTGVRQYSKIVSKEEKKDESSKYKQIWKNFISGYKYYLEEMKMETYSRYDLRGHRTSIFKYFFKNTYAQPAMRKINMRDMIIYTKTKLLIKKIEKK